MEEINNRFLGKKLKFQLFADPDDPGTPPGGDPGDQDPPKSYSQEEVDKLLAKQKEDLGKTFEDKLNKKFAQYKEEAKKKADEAARLAEMNAQEKAEHERDELQKELDALKAKDARNAMIAESRKTLSEQGITVSEGILNALVTNDAETTQKAVSEFAELFNADVAKAVKAKLAGDPPPADPGAAPKVTKEEIMAIKDPVKRQELIAKNMQLFRKE